MRERSNRAASKAVELLVSSEGSNPSLSGYWVAVLDPYSKRIIKNERDSKRASAPVEGGRATGGRSPAREAGWKEQTGGLRLEAESLSLRILEGGYCFGEMTERPKVHAWKACVSYPDTEGSNPSLSVVFPFSVDGQALRYRASPNPVRTGR